LKARLVRLLSGWPVTFTRSVPSPAPSMTPWSSALPPALTVKAMRVALDSVTVSASPTSQSSWGTSVILKAPNCSSYLAPELRAAKPR
jgi:hypothetical protein